jgi:RhtB (resistance to homoserine/threonine) family protein
MEWFDARYAGFVALSALLIVTPGPDTALIIRNALSAGPRASTRTAVGVAVGTLVWATAATLGVGAILERSFTAFTVLKLVGAAYLCYLGVRSLLSSGPEKSDDAPEQQRSLRDRDAFRQGLLSNLLNPKTGAFYVTVMPQFLNPGDTRLRVILMVAAFELILLIWLITYGHVVSRIGSSGPGLRVRRALTRVTGVVLIGLGARLAFERR